MIESVCIELPLLLLYRLRFKKARLFRGPSLHLVLQATLFITCLWFQWAIIRSIIWTKINGT